MLKFRNLSLQRKQTLVMMLTSSIVLLLACIAFVVFDSITFRRQLSERVLILANAIGNNCAAALDFNDRKSAEEMLAALHSDNNIVSACVYSRDGKVFATYQRDESSAFVPPTLGAAGRVFTGDQLHMFHPIEQRGEVVGTIFVASDLKDISARLMRYLEIVGAVFLLSLLIALALSGRLQRLVSDPILNLAQVARSVALEKNYSVRAAKRSEDELGQLVDGFNDMLGQIEQRDAALQSAREGLEARVAERTTELAKSNQDLQAEISERQRTAEKLLVQATALDAAANAIVITDQAGTIEWVNRAFTTLTGYTSQEAVGQNPRILKSDKQDEAFYRNLWQTISSGQIWSGELTNRRKDGSLYAEEMTITPLRNTERVIVRYIAVKRDITERKRDEELLRLTEERFRIAAETTNDAIFEWDLKQSVEWPGKIGIDELLGYEPGEFPHAMDSFAASLHPEDVEPVMVAIQAQLERRVPFALEYRVRRKDGVYRWWSARGAVARTPEGTPTRWIGSVTDITERKRDEAELEQAHKQLVETSRLGGMAEIATNVLHNVGNVLNSVNISTGLIVESVKKSRTSSLARVVALLQEHAQDLGTFITTDARGKHLPAHLAQLSENLLADQVAIVGELDLLRRNIEHIKEIVAMQQNYATVGGVKEIINVVHLVEDSLRINEDALNRHRVELIREFETVPPLNVEKHKILQILVNLLRNAKHACQDSERADPRLTVRVANGAGRVKISVMDNGIGIPAENLTRIFNYGFTTRKDGHGFGLHSGALAAQEMGGSLTVHSDGTGHGATFTLELPLSDEGGLN